MKAWQLGALGVVGVAVVLALTLAAGPGEGATPRTVDDISAKSSPADTRMGEGYDIAPVERRTVPSRVEFDALTRRVEKLEKDVEDLKAKVASPAPAKAAPKPN